MREIKFRAWDKHNKVMAMQSDCDPVLVWDRENNPTVFELRADHFELMQYTGLKDKNGKEIYEGDILKWKKFRHIDRNGSTHSGEADRMTVEWTLDKDIFSKGWNINFFITEHICEVIGNIYENKDLLR